MRDACSDVLSSLDGFKFMLCSMVLVSLSIGYLQIL